jgi:hypothetical protein
MHLSHIGYLKGNPIILINTQSPIVPLDVFLASSHPDAKQIPIMLMHETEISYSSLDSLVDLFDQYDPMEQSIVGNAAMNRPLGLNHPFISEFPMEELSYLHSLLRNESQGFLVLPNIDSIPTRPDPPLLERPIPSLDSLISKPKKNYRPNIEDQKEFNWILQSESLSESFPPCFKSEIIQGIQPTEGFTILFLRNGERHVVISPMHGWIDSVYRAYHPEVVWVFDGRFFYRAEQTEDPEYLPLYIQLRQIIPIQVFEPIRANGTPISDSFIYETHPTIIPNAIISDAPTEQEQNEEEIQDAQ